MSWGGYQTHQDDVEIGVVVAAKHIHCPGRRVKVVVYFERQSAAPQKAPCPKSVQITNQGIGTAIIGKPKQRIQTYKRNKKP
jgi:hypothetical protein